MTVLPVTEATFEGEVLRSEAPVLIDFHADWCGPCKQLTPIVEEVAAELKGKLKVVSVDVDTNPNVAGAFRVQSIPALFVVHQGRVVANQMGVLPKAAILEMVQPFLPADAGQVANKELAALLSQRRAVAVDIRDAGSYGRARIPGAIHIAKDDLASQGASLQPVDGRIRVLYGRTTDDARAAADELASAGVEVAFLEGGFLYWEADGFEVEKPDA